MGPRRQLQRVQLAEGALPEVRALLADPERLAVIEEAHRAAGIWVEHVFLEEFEGHWYFWSYTESEDPTSHPADLDSIETPELVEIRAQFRSWTVDLSTAEYQVSVFSPPR